MDDVMTKPLKPETLKRMLENRRKLEPAS